MKKKIGIFLAAVMLLLLTACGQTGGESTPQESTMQMTVESAAEPTASATTATQTTAASSITAASSTAETSAVTETASSAVPETSATAESAVTTAASSMPQETAATETDIPTAPATTEIAGTTEITAAEIPETPAETGKTLIVCFSWSPSGNTEIMANVIRERTGGDILRIEPETAYPTDYSRCGEVAKVERDENARPGIADLPASLDAYDTVFVGYPIWWHTAPMIIGTFLESYDLTGKAVYPFAQSASMDTEQFANSMAFVRESASGADVHEGLFTRASDTDGILDYLTENGFAA